MAQAEIIEYKPEQNSNLNPSNKLLALIAKGLQDYSKESTVNQLGDRSQYVGMSDIALMQECPRLAVLRKVQPMNNEVVTMQNFESILKKQLVLQRGHWLEDGIANALYANGFQLIPQLELSVIIDNIPVKIHFDFVLLGENAIRILELKSNATIQKNLSKSYTIQIQGQVAMLQKYWNKPVFNLTDPHGLLLYKQKTFSEICKDYLGLTVQNDVGKLDLQGWLLSVSMTEAKAYGPYIPTQWVEKLCETATKFQWKYMQDYFQSVGSIIPHAKGFCLLCSCCEYAIDCPKFASEQLPEWEQKLEELEKLKILKSQTADEIAIIEDTIKQSIFPTEQKGKWIEAGSHRFRVAEQVGRKSLDKDRLYAELVPIMGEEETTNLFSRCENEGAPSARLYTNNITRKGK